MEYPMARPYGAASGGGSRFAPQSGRVSAGRDVFRDEAGAVWSWQGASMFLLFHRWLLGEDIGPQVDWMLRHGVNVARVLGMVRWGALSFGPQTPGFWEKLPQFADYLAERSLRLAFCVFASAQDVLPERSAQRAHLRRVHDALGAKWNVFLQVGNEPWQNGVVPAELWGADEPRRCPMDYGDYVPTVRKDGAVWRAELPALDFLGPHLPRMAGWERKAKDLSEFRDGSGDGSENGPLMAGLHKACVSDEPMGAAEPDQLAAHPGQRSADPAAHFGHHANARLNGAGSTIHNDAGLQALVPPAGGAQERCADAVTLAWSLVEPEFQTGRYTRTGLPDLPLAYRPEQFPEQTGRIYARILGNRACAVAIGGSADWEPAGADGWRVTAADGPGRTLVHLER